MNLSGIKVNLIHKILPKYEELGEIEGVFIKGSLVNGYTNNADFDVTIVWSKNLPTNRYQLINSIRQNAECLVVDYEEIHMDRFVLDGQEYNISHIVVDEFDKQIKQVLNGEGFLTKDILQPIISVSGFYYGEVIKDENKNLSSLKKKLDNFPQTLKINTKKLFENRKQSHINHITVFLKRGDIYAIYKELVDAVEVFLIAYFAQNNIYYPGYKWLNKSIERFKLDSQIPDLINQLFNGDTKMKLEQYKELISLIY